MLQEFSTFAFSDDLGFNHILLLFVLNLCRFRISRELGLAKLCSSFKHKFGGHVIQNNKHSGF